MLHKHQYQHLNQIQIPFPSQYIMPSWGSIDYSPGNTHHLETLPYSLQFIEQREEMVKFSKQFEGQLIPEWKEAFVDYWQLKKDLKRIHLLNNTNSTPNKHHSSSLPKSFFSSLRKYSLFGHQHREHGPIQVNLF